jgi:carboxyl-terminal processing protease
MNKRNRIGALLLAVLLAYTLLTGCSLLPTASSSVMNALDANDETVTVSREEYDRLQKYASLDTLSQMVEEYYYVEPDFDAMLEGAKRGLLAGLGDPYTYFYNAEEYTKLWEDDTGEYAGIGIQISASYITMMCTITRVFAGSPAEAAGIHKGDILTRVDTLDVTAATLNDAVRIVRGQVDTPVDVQVLRDSELIDFTITRKVVHVNWVSSTMLPGDVAYIQLYEFAGDCYARFQEQLNALMAQGAKALIIDLRDNPGGWVEDAVKLADIFLPEENVTYMIYRDGSRDDYNATAGSISIPMVMILNENSASASEILAGAFQDYGIATVVGTQSYGKGIVQFVMPVGDSGEGMQLTTAQYYTPKGRSLHKVGITPDIEAKMPEGDVTLYELGDLNDAQLKAAYDIAIQKRDGTFIAPTPTAAPEVTESPEGEAASVNVAPAAESSVWRVS